MKGIRIDCNWRRASRARGRVSEPRIRTPSILLIVRYGKGVEKGCLPYSNANANSGTRGRRVAGALRNRRGCAGRKLDRNELLQHKLKARVGILCVDPGPKRLHICNGAAMAGQLTTLLLCWFAVVGSSVVTTTGNKTEGWR